MGDAESPLSGLPIDEVIRDTAGRYEDSILYYMRPSLSHISWVIMLLLFCGAVATIILEPWLRKRRDGAAKSLAQLAVDAEKRASKKPIEPEPVDVSTPAPSSDATTPTATRRRIAVEFKPLEELRDNPSSRDLADQAARERRESAAESRISNEEGRRRRWEAIADEQDVAARQQLRQHREKELDKDARREAREREIQEAREEAEREEASKKAAVEKEKAKGAAILEKMKKHKESRENAREEQEIARIRQQEGQEAANQAYIARQAEKKRKENERKLQEHEDQKRRVRAEEERRGGGFFDNAFIDRSSMLHSSVAERLREDRRIREEQDEEYQRSLHQDSHRAELEERKRKAKMQRQQLLKEREERYAALEAEPGEKEQDITTLRIKLPDGSTLVRRFRLDDTIETVQRYIEGKGGKQVKEHYRLVSHFPSQTYADPSTTLRDAQLNRVQLFIE